MAEAFRDRFARRLASARKNLGSLAGGLALALLWSLPAGAEPVTVRAGLHADFGRIVFDWPARVGHGSDIDGAALTIRFERPIEARYDEVVGRLRQRVAAEIKTTFASHYTNEVSLAGMLTADAIAVYGKQATGEKYLVTPNKDI